MTIIILLSQTNGVYGFFQDDGTDPQPVIQEMVAQRQAIEKRYIAYEKQKALEKEKTKERLSWTKIRLEQMRDAQGRKNINTRSNMNIESKNGSRKNTAAVQSFKIAQIILLIAGLFGCVFWIYKINKKKL
ncbi:MAG: hypothetical protein V1747_02750 [Candidatus Omnitrophota bacterium]